MGPQGGGGRIPKEGVVTEKALTLVATSLALDFGGAGRECFNGSMDEFCD